MNFLLLMTAHFFGDFVFQSKWMCEEKGKTSLFMFAHAWIWTACVCFTLNVLGLFTIPKMIFLFIGHYCIDKFKCLVIEELNKLFSDQYGQINSTDKNKAMMKLVYGDQLLHVAQILCVLYF